MWERSQIERKNLREGLNRLAESFDYIKHARAMRAYESRLRDAGHYTCQSDEETRQYLGLKSKKGEDQRVVKRYKY